jgi:hypothetical protein
VALCAALLWGLTGCGDTPADNAASSTPTTETTMTEQVITLDVPDRTATTRSSTYTVTGTVDPATAQVVLRGPGGTTRTARAVDGDFTATVPLRVGTNRFHVTGRQAGYTAPRDLTISITRTKPKPKPKPEPAASPPAETTTQQPASKCDPNYAGACVPIASDVDCAGGSGNGPAYVQGPVRVVGTDIYDLDRDGDGIGCNT